MDVKPFVSIIIPVREINDYIQESMRHINDLDFKNFEVLIFPDGESNEIFDKARIIPTGTMGPAEKRDLALKYAKGEILAFLDDDAYPTTEWLTYVVDNFNDQNVGAVGGPAITPPDNNILQKASGLVFETFMGGGSNRYRYIPAIDKFDVDDLRFINKGMRSVIGHLTDFSNKEKACDCDECGN